MAAFLWLLRRCAGSSTFWDARGAEATAPGASVMRPVIGRRRCVNHGWRWCIIGRRWRIIGRLRLRCDHPAQDRGCAQSQYCAGDRAAVVVIIAVVTAMPATTMPATTMPLAMVVPIRLSGRGGQ